MKTILTTLLCWLLLFGTVSALTLEEAIEHALKSAESQRITRHQAQVLKEQTRQNIAFIWPQLTVRSAYLKLGNNQENTSSQFTIPGLTEADNVTVKIPGAPNPGQDISAELNLRQVVYSGGQIWEAIEIRDNQYDQAEIDEALGAKQLKALVKQTYDAVLFNKSNLRILQDRFDQRETELKDAQDLYAAGMVTGLDVRRAQVYLNNALNDYKEGEALLLESLITFNRVLGRGGEQKKWLPEGELGKLEDLEGLLDEKASDLSINTNQELKNSRNRLEFAKLQHQFSKGDNLPQVYLVYNYKTSGEQTDDLNENWYYGLQLTWNAFDGYSTRAKTAEAWNQVQMAHESYLETQKKLQSEVDAIRVRISTLNDQIELQEEVISLSRQNYEDSRAQYRAGTITLTDVGNESLSYAESRFRLQSMFFSQLTLLRRIEDLGE